MLTKGELCDILSSALRDEADFSEIFLEESNSTSIFCEDGKIEKIVSGIDAGAGVRIIRGESIYYTFLTKADFPSLKEAVKTVAGVLKEGKKIDINLKPSISNLEHRILRKPNEVPIDEKIHAIELANKTARSYGEAIKQVTISYSNVNQAVRIANSDGIYIEDNRIRTRFVINVVAEKDGLLQTAFEGPGGSCGFELFQKYPPEEVAKLAVERVLLLLNAKPAPSGRMPVVISAEAGGTLIHEACGHALEADFIMKGTSIFANKIGKKVASDLVTVVDDGKIPGNYGSAAFDDEGTPSQRTILIENGILKGFMSDKFTAKKLSLKPSGNGRRESFRTKPNPRMSNTFIAPHKSDPKEIINSIKYGLLVKRMGGGEVNVTNGDFVFEVQEGYLIENGKIRYPVRGAMLTGNGPHVLEIIDMVGWDLDFKPGTCGKADHVPVSDGQPTIRIPELIVGGRI